MVSSGRACEISQFWQNLQSKLHPAVAMENDRVDGSTWKKGFFSTGSTCTAQGFPKTRE
jgi:hypothetical protein